MIGTQGFFHGRGFYINERINTEKFKHTITSIIAIGSAYYFSRKTYPTDIAFIIEMCNVGFAIVFLGWHTLFTIKRMYWPNGEAFTKKIKKFIGFRVVDKETLMRNYEISKEEYKKELEVERKRLLEEREENIIKHLRKRILREERIALKNEEKKKKQEEERKKSEEKKKIKEEKREEDRKKKEEEKRKKEEMKKKKKNDVNKTERFSFPKVTISDLEMLQIAMQSQDEEMEERPKLIILNKVQFDQDERKGETIIRSKRIPSPGEKKLKLEETDPANISTELTLKKNLPYPSEGLSPRLKHRKIQQKEKQKKMDKLNITF